VTSFARLIARMEADGLELFAEPGRLRYRAQTRPSGQLLADIATRKPLLLRWLENGRPTPRIYPLTPPQRQLWALAQMWGDSRGNVAYREPLALRVEGSVDPGVLERAVERLMTRHEVLCTEIEPCGLRQTVVPGLAPPVVHLGERPLKALIDAVVEEASTARPLDVAPTFRVLHGQSGGVSMVGLACHHVTCDGISIATLLEELGTLYEAELERPRGPVPLPSPRSFEDYVHRRAHLRSTPRGTADRSHWADRVRSAAGPNYGGARSHRARRLIMPLALGWRALSRAATAQRVTPFALALAVFARAIEDAEGEASWGLVTMDYRSFADCPSTVGYCSEVYPVQLQSRGVDWPRLCKASCHALLDIVAHHSCSLADLAGDPGVHAPVARFTSTFMDLTNLVRFGSRRASVVYAQAPYRDAPLTMNLHRVADDRLVVCCDHALDVYSSATASDTLRRVARAFSEVAETPPIETRPVAPEDLHLD
jgi:hypothetical protein